MITQYKRLLSLGIEHPYYSEGCRDFNFIISPDAARLLRRGKCLAKEHDGKLLVLFEANDNGAPLADLSGHRIRIGLKLCNPYFGNFTD